MSDAQIWWGVVSALLLTCGYFCKGVVNQLKEIAAILKRVEIQNEGTKKDIEALKKETKDNKERLNNYSSRMRDMELAVEGCPTCKRSKKG